jgi:TolA-binding protein
MRRDMSQSLILLAILLTTMGIAPAQTVVLKDGRVLAASRVQRSGDQVKLSAASGAEAGVGVAEIVRIDFPEPPELSEAAAKMVDGKGEEAAVLLERLVSEQADFREIPGNWWALAALRQAQALEGQGRGLEAQALADKIAKQATDPESAKAAEAQIAAVLLRRGDLPGATRRVDAVLGESRSAVARALAYVVKGQCLLAEEKWEDAMLSFVQVPVFYPGETTLLPAVMLGRGRALLGMEDFSSARSTLEELRIAYPGAPESKLALQELQRVGALEKGGNLNR